MRESTPTVTAYAAQTDCLSLNKTAMPAARPVPVFRRSWGFLHVPATLLSPSSTQEPGSVTD